MSADPNDRLIQRAVDGELSNDERRELFEQCDEAGAWKNLACAFLEDQLVGQAIRDRSSAFSAEDRDVLPVRPAKRAALRWYQHPAMAVGMTVCTAFVLGLVFPWDVGGVAPSSQPMEPLWLNKIPNGVMPLRSAVLSGQDERESVVFPADEMDVLMNDLRHLIQEIERRPLPQSEFRPFFPLIRQPPWMAPSDPVE